MGGELHGRAAGAAFGLVVQGAAGAASKSHGQMLHPVHRSSVGTLPSSRVCACSVHMMYWRCSAVKDGGDGSDGGSGAVGAGWGCRGGTGGLSGVSVPQWGHQSRVTGAPHVGLGQRGMAGLLGGIWWST